MISIDFSPVLLFVILFVFERPVVWWQSRRFSAMQLLMKTSARTPFRLGLLRTVRWDDVIVKSVLHVWRTVLPVVKPLPRFSARQIMARGDGRTSKLVSFSVNRRSGTTLGPSTSTTPPFAGAAGAGLGVQYSFVLGRPLHEASITPSDSCLIDGTSLGMSLGHDQVLRKNI